MNWDIKSRVDLSRGSHSAPRFDPNVLMQVGNKKSHRWDIEVYRGKEPVDLSGATVVGYFTRADFQTVPVTGSASGNIASVVTEQSCCAVAGAVTMWMDITLDGVTLTLDTIIVNVRKDDTGVYVDPGTVVPNLQELLAMVDECEEAADAANDAAEAAEEAAAALNMDAVFIKKSATTTNADVGYTDIPDGADDVKLKSCIVSITAKQSGSGTPSSENIRPIVGYTGMTFTQLGPDLKPDTAPENIGSIAFAAGDTVISASASGAVVRAIPVIKNSTYFFKKRTGYGLIYAFGDTPTPSAGTPIYNSGGVTSSARYVPNVDSGDHAYLYICASRSNYMSLVYPALRIYLQNWNIGDVTLDHVNSVVKTIDWDSAAGKIVGGTYDLLTGKLTKKYGYIASYNGESVGTNWICDRAVYNSSTQPTPPVGSEVAWPLSTSVIYDLEPTDINTRYSGNVFMSDAGAVDVEYYADTKKYIDDRIAELQAMILEH